jgi:hypothetical protein
MDSESRQVLIGFEVEGRNHEGSGLTGSCLHSSAWRAVPAPSSGRLATQYVLNSTSFEAARPKRGVLVATTFQVTFDCAAPLALADFWADTLGYKPSDPPQGFATWEEWLKKMNVPEEEWDAGRWIQDPEERGPRIFFQQVPEPKIAKNRLHLDLDVSGGPGTPLDKRREQVDAEADRLLRLGASRLGIYEQGDHYHVVMQDPEGNEFCLR